jgi:SAM-dependent methyltransferase
MTCQDRFFPEATFGGFTNHDGTVAFYLRVNALTTASCVVLDVGCGRGAYQDDPIALRRSLRILRGKVQKVIGLDLDMSAISNPFLDEFRLLEDQSAHWPVGDHSVDLIVCDWTLEHIADPAFFFEEASRVLKTGGYFCARTTNAWGLVALAARVVPEKYHAGLIAALQRNRKVDDVFPTHYACNSVVRLQHCLTRHGFEGVVLGFGGLTEYLKFSCVLYRL